MTTSQKMLLRGFGYTKEQVGWTDADEKVLRDLIPDRDMMLEVIKNDRRRKVIRSSR